MSRYQDTVIDDDEETCPLCIEEFDLSDRNFKPCPCGYQICQFCFNSLKTTYEKSTCPNCRRPYDEATIQYKIPTAEELKLDQLNKNKKLAAAKRKETEKREVESSNRRNLAGVRVKQQNLVYVIGLEPSKKDEATLMETLRGKDYFGQYGPIEKIVVSKPKPGAINQGVGVYVTFKNKEDAAKCISCVDNSPNGERTLRAQYGTTKYCSTFLRGDVCQNKNCSFLHEAGEDGQNTSLQNEPIESKMHNVPHRSQSTPQPAATSQPMARESSREGATSRQGSADGSALPPTAGWANAPVARARRASQATSTSSPLLTHVAVATKKQEPAKQSEPTAQSPAAAPVSSPSPVPSQQPSPVSSTKSEHVLVDPAEIIFQHLKKTVTSTNCLFRFDDSSLADEVKAIIAIMPPLFDPYGGAKRRIMQDREAEARAKLEAEDKQRLEEQARSAAEEALEEDDMATGSLALGGEPEENPRSASARGTIGRPPHQTPATNIPIDQLSNLNLNRSLTPQQQRQQQQLAMLNAGSVPQSRAPQPPAQNTAFEMSDFDRRGPQYSQAQYDQISSHARHGSRYFNNESKANNARFPSQQQPYFSSGVQGPPPGLPTAGTPPISGGGMFAHGQGFASSGFGATKDPVVDALRTRSGTNAGHDVKRGGVEHLAADPSILSARIHQGAGGQGLFGGNQVDQDFPPLPKRTESQSAVHSRVSSIQSGNAFRAGTPKVPPGFERTSTPKMPPGLENLHAHPTPSDRIDPLIKASPKKEGSTVPIAPVVPAVPVIPLVHRKSSLVNEPKVDEVKSAQLIEPELVKEETKVNDIKVEPKVELEPPKQKEGEMEVKLADDDITSARNATEAAAQGGPKQEPKAERTQPVNEDKKADASNIEASEPTVPEPVLVEEVEQGTILEDDVLGAPAIMSRAITPPLQNKIEAKRPTLRTLNVTSEMVEQFRRTESGAPPSTTTERSFTLATVSQIRRQHSRQPSISTSRPSTPGVSERLMSQDVSRAGSPPPSLVGSAAVRQKNTAQRKKERKAKKAPETSDAGSVAAASTPPAEEVGPIVARRKKQKKPKTASSTEEPVKREVEQQMEPTKEDSKPASPVKKGFTKESEKIVEDVPSPKTETPPPMLEPPKPPYTLRDFYTDAAKLQAQYNGDETITDEQLTKSIQDVLTSHISPLPKLLSEMIASGDLAKDHPLFNPPSFSSAAYKLSPDHRKGQAYLDGNNYNPSDTFGYVYLPQKEKKALYRGHAVSVADSGDRKNDLLRRCLITPGGWLLRHLSAEESEKVLDLEERRSLYLEEFGDLGVMDKLGALEDNDYINLEGGFDELSRYGERHGVMWVVGENEQNERGRRARYGRTGTVEDDYGLGEMPVDGDELSDDDHLDDDEEDDDELEGEEMVLEAEVDEDGQFIDEEGDDLGFVDLADAPGMSLPPLPSMPGGWDPTFNGSHSMYGGLGTYPPYSSELDMPLPPPPTNVNLPQVSQAAYNRASNTLPPLGGQYARHTGHTVNLRAMDTDALQKRVNDKQKEAESARKDAERQEKALAKKGKDHARWRDSVFKGVQEFKG